ncbi:MAG: hypothetical protein IT262_21610 [Saprospiraceae bacterium]|nr:hypothetical protein [Saprospiraceae bacterium]
MNKSDVKQLIAESRLDEAIEAMLLMAQDSRHETEMLQLSGRFREMEKQKRMGIESSGDLDRTRNKITVALLQLLDELPAGATVNISVSKPPVSTNTGGTGNGNPPVSTTTTGTGNGDAKPPVSTGTGDGGSSKTSVWIGVASLAAILAAVLFVPCPSSAQFFVFRLILALGAAGIGSILPGFLNIDTGVAKAGGALALFTLVFLLNPAHLMGDERCKKEESVSLTVFVNGKNGQSIQPLRQQGYVVLDVNGERKKELIDDKGQASFKNLRPGDKIRHVNVEFSEPFVSTRPDSVYTLDASGQIYLEVALKHLGRVFGTVLSRDEPLGGVVVLVDNTFRDTTDATGSYSISIPETAQRSDPEVKFFKEGYRLEIKKAFPQTNQPLNLVMQKLPVKKR